MTNRNRSEIEGREEEEGGEKLDWIIIKNFVLEISSTKWR